MRHVLSVLALVAALSGEARAAEPGSEAPRLQVVITCPESPRCKFSGDELELDIALRNPSDEAVAFPFAMLDRMGPVVTLRDNNPPHEEIHGRRSVPRPDLRDQLTVLEPGESVSMMPYTIDRSMVEGFDGRHLDFTATILLAVPDETGQASIEFGAGSIVIRGGRR